MMILDELHPVLKRQLIKCGFTDGALANEQLTGFILKVHKAYVDADQGRYLKERALEVSSQEMKEMYETIQSEKVKLESLLHDLLEKDQLLNEKNTELMAQRNYATSLISSIVDMLFVLDNKLDVVDINDSVIKMLGKERADIVGKNIADFLAEIKPINGLLDSLDNANGAKTATANFLTELLLDPIKTLPVLFSASLIYDDVGKLNGIICLVKDISELRKLEQENAEKLILLTHAGRLASLGEMATGVAHELNQPLSIVRTNMQTLEFLSLEELSPEDLKELVSSTIRQVDRATKIIGHMRDFARQKKDIRKAIELHVPVDAAIGMFHEQFRLHEINIIRNFEDDLPLIYAETQEIEQIVVNLLSNARYAVELRKETEGNGFKMTITLNLYHNKESNEVILEVEDNGAGMSKETLEHCFDPFFTTKPVGEGTGLGLAIVYNIIKNLNGQFVIQSEPNVRTKASFSIPIPQAQAV
ncbi:MAG: PAS domain-containing protein [Gammaproteobacteria bacterium]|nr:PAS domain-containing protein [Gammaproteobacteria bacterium]